MRREGEPLGVGSRTDQFKHQLNLHLSFLSDSANDFPVFGQLKNTLERFAEEVAEDIQTIRDDAETVSLGLSMSHTKKFRNVMKDIRVNESSSGRWEIIKWGDSSFQQYIEYARFALEYITNLVLLAQEVYPGPIETIRIKIPLIEQEIWKKEKKSD